MPYNLTQHDGKFIKFGGQWIGKIKQMYTLTLQNDGNGTLTATKLTGYAGDTVTLTPTYNTYYRFSGYENTGGEIVGNTFTFGEDNATAKAYFSGNLFSASGDIPVESTYYNPTTTYHTIMNGYTYARLLASSDNVPSTWTAIRRKSIQPNTSKKQGSDNTEFDDLVVWNPLNCSSYNMNVNYALYYDAGYNRTIGKTQSWNIALYVNDNLYNNREYTAASTSEYAGGQSQYSLDNSNKGIVKLSATCNTYGVVNPLSSKYYDRPEYRIDKCCWSASGYAP